MLFAGSALRAPESFVVGNVQIWRKIYFRDSSCAIISAPTRYYPMRGYGDSGGGGAGEHFEQQCCEF